MLRGTVPELIDFAWRMFHVSASPDTLALADVRASCLIPFPFLLLPLCAPLPPFARGPL